MFQICFSSVSEACFLRVSTTFRRMLQLLFFLCLKSRSGVVSLFLLSSAASFLLEPADIHMNKGWAMGVE